MGRNAQLKPRALPRGCLDHLCTPGSLQDVQARLLAFPPFWASHYHVSPHASLMGRTPAEVYETAPRDAKPIPDGRKLRELKERLKNLRTKGGRAMTDYLRLHLLGYQHYYGVSGCTLGGSFQPPVSGGASERLPAGPELPTPASGRNTAPLPPRPASVPPAGDGFTEARIGPASIVNLRRFNAATGER